MVALHLVAAEFDQRVHGHLVLGALGHEHQAEGVAELQCRAGDPAPGPQLAVGPTQRVRDQVGEPRRSTAQDVS